MILTNAKLYTDPKLSPAKPTPADINTRWYVWFRFFDELTNTWKQLRYKQGINQFHSYRERILEANALKKALKEALQEGWNPLVKEIYVPGEPPPVKLFSIQETIEYVFTIKAATIRTKSKYAYRYIINLFLEWCEKKNLLNTGIKYFTTGQAQQYMDWLLMHKQYSGRTFNDHLIVLRTFFNCCIDRDWIAKNPFRAVKRKTQTVGRNLAYSEAERELLQKTLREKDIRMYYFSQIMFHTFIRRTELTCIQVKHVDLVNHTIIIPGKIAKNNRQETVTIPQELDAILAEMNLQQYGPEDYLFGRHMLTGPVQYKNPNWISSRHNDVVKALQIDSEKGLYSWKHTGVCYYYYLTNKDVYAVMRQLRHRDLNTTMIYMKSIGLVQNDAIRNARSA